MSQSAEASAAVAGDEDPEPRTVKARVSDPDLLRALEDAESDASMAAVVRDSLRMSLLTDDEAPAQRQVAMPDRPVLRKAYRTLVSLADVHVEGGGLRVSESKARDQLYTNNTPKDAVMDVLVKPLVRQGFAKIDTGWETSWVTVRPLAPKAGAAADCALCGADGVEVFLTDRDHPAGRNYAACSDCHNVTEEDR